MIRDLLGQKFGRLLVIEQSSERRNKGVIWKCLCDCGEYSNVRSGCLTRGKTKSCGCQRNAIRKRKPYGEASFNALYVKYKHTANKKNLEFSFSQDEFKNITSQNCHYCGIKPIQSDKGQFHGYYVYNGIDRLDSSLGYTIKNCVPCCKTCNYAKHTLSIQEFMIWIDRLIEYQSQGK